MKVLFATDGSEHSLATEDLLSSVPFADITEVTILNVTWSTFTDIPERFIKERDELTDNPLQICNHATSQNRKGSFKKLLSA